MFNQQNTSPFGQPAATPFGAPSPAPFGTQTPAPAFGAAPATGFGQQTATFGSTTPAPAFGAPAPAFGAAPAPTAFGAPTTFGTTTTTMPAFGNTATTQQSPFGAQTQTSLFGSAPATGTNLFGSTPTPAPAFGAAPATTGFGATTTTSTFGASTFGASASGGIFGGGTTPAPAPFGSPAPATGGLFGSAPAPAPLFGAAPTATAPATPGIFGAPASSASPGAVGSRAAPFSTTTAQDGSSSISFHTITAMPQFKNKSAEEIRMEDYGAGNRGDQQQAGGGGFGTTTTGAFGSSTPAPAFGGFGAPSPTPGGFGASPTPAPFGAQAPATFGSSPAPASGGFGGFGQQAPAPAFGSTAPAPAFGGFGTTTPSPAPTGGLFGSTTASPASLFGGGTPAAAPTGGLFGAPAPAPTGGLFGGPSPAPATGGLFGSAPAPAPTGGLFGSAPAAPAPSGGLFGAPAPAAPAPGGFGFSSPSPAPGGFGGFGQPAPAFGASAAGGLFGNPAPATGGLFGGTAPAASAAPAFGLAPAAPAAAYPPAASIVPDTTDAVLAQQIQAIKNKQEELAQTEVWRGRSPQTSSVIPTSLPEPQLRVSPYSAGTPTLEPYRAPTPRSTARIRPRGIFSSQTPQEDLRLAKPAVPIMAPELRLTSATKRLVIDPKVPEPRLRLRMQPLPSPAVEESKEEVLALPAAARSPAASVAESPAPVESPPAEATPRDSTPRTSTPASNARDRGFDYFQRVTANAGATPGARRTPDVSSPAEEKKSESLVPTLTRPGHVVSPSLEEMERMTDAELAAVSGFTVSREGVGSIAWEGSVDVTGGDLDTVVTIEQAAAAVYEDDDAKGTKPPVGTKLNGPAIITMYNVYPPEGSDADAVEKFERKVEKSTRKNGAELISYNSQTGVWKFRVRHFSRYELRFDDSDEEDEVVVEQNFESGERGGRSPGASLEAVSNDDEDEDMAVEVYSDYMEMEMHREEAAKAYSMLSSGLDQRLAKPKSVLKKKSTPQPEVLFEDECAVIDDAKPAKPLPPDAKDLAPKSTSGFCARIAQRCGVQSFSASSTDFGMRMGRSFRVGWNPDGSFFHLQRGSATVLQQSRPVFANDETPGLIDNHLKHASKIKTDRECPVFSLAPESGTSRNKEILSALRDYVAISTPQDESYADKEEASILMRAFSLLLCLFAKDDNGDTNDAIVPMIDGHGESKAQVVLRQQERIESCIKWLTEACETDVLSDVRIALQNSNVVSAIFAACSGGDIEQAISIATKHNYLHLASLLATGAAGFDSVQEQVERWAESGAAASISTDMLRIYTLLAGDVKTEEQVHLRCVQSGASSHLDWRRRLCMLLTFGAHPNDEASLESLLAKYEDDVSREVAPYPFPRYAIGSATGGPDAARSMLYKMLQLARSTDSLTLAQVVDPSGYTADLDFSGAFHVAAAISALERGPMLSPVEQARLLDSYAAQLVSSGRWDLAVYVMLCSFGAVACPQDLLLRERAAKSIVLQNYRFGAEGERSRLEKIGLPASWFEEALGYNSAHAGDAVGYIGHLGKFDPEEARLALEDLVVPNMLFASAADIEESLKLVSLYTSDKESLAAVVVDLVELAEDVCALSQKKDSSIDADAIAESLATAASIHERLLAHRVQNERMGPSCKVFPTYRPVPRSAFLEEALAGVSFLQLQLKAMEAGSSIWGEGMMKVSSELAYIAMREAASNQSASITEGRGNDMIF